MHLALKKMAAIILTKRGGFAKPSLNFKGFTLMEIIVSLVILSLVIGGLANVIILGKRFILHSRSRMAGGELGKVFVEPLQMQVRETETSTGAQNGWEQANNCLSSSPTNGCPTAVVNIGGIDYTPTWNVAPVPGTGLRRVSVSLSWTER
jgi:prepilin-type N-terminal cleavage/methylation domain-containing protein